MNRNHTKTCYCWTCRKSFHPKGIAMHRTAHKRRNEKCTIEFTNGNCETWNFDEVKKDLTTPEERG